ncbi:MAG: hypothetical protein O3C63_02045 [Cyanobacteria bacterium]|nr:hypothetical protein [Cyanobacteriota bacterium]
MTAIQPSAPSQANAAAPQRHAEDAGVEEVKSGYTTVAQLQKPAQKISSSAKGPGSSNPTGKTSSYGPQNQGDFSAIA